MSAKILTLTGAPYTPHIQASQETPAQVAERADGSQIGKRIVWRGDSMEWLGQQMQHYTWGMVSDWREVWELGVKFEAFHLSNSLKRKSDLSEADSLDLAYDAKEGADFWRRCGKIYAEEMQKVERLAAEARERIAARLVREIGDNAGTRALAEHLRANTPQEYCADFDWQ